MLKIDSNAQKEKSGQFSLLFLKCLTANIEDDVHIKCGGINML
jgi:hypothetical protein